MSDLRDLITAGNRFPAILADPPWHFRSWTNGRWKGDGKIFTPAKAPEYHTMSVDQICGLPVQELAAPDCALFVWGIWCMLPEVLRVINAWGFEYKTNAFTWIKTQRLDPAKVKPGLGYWVRQSSEFCFLATRGRPKRKGRYVIQGIIEPAREHSRKPDCAYDRIEQLIDGPYLELFARTERPGWTAWGNEVDKFGRAACFSPACPAAERVPQLRTLRAIAHMTLGHCHALVDLLRRAETDNIAFGRAEEVIDQLPALHRRRLLASFSAITWPAKSKDHSP
jgi:N6-adenosine-specific RNA methylase IME4